jgi:hypothetical protein
MATPTMEEHGTSRRGPWRRPWWRDGDGSACTSAAATVEQWRRVVVDLRGGGGGGTATARGGPPRLWRWMDGDRSPWCLATAAVEGRQRVAVELGAQPTGRESGDECAEELMELTEHKFRGGLGV